MEMEYPEYVDVHLLRLHIFLFDGEENYAGISLKIQEIIDRFSPLESEFASMLFRIVNGCTTIISYQSVDGQDFCRYAPYTSRNNFKEYLRNLDDVSLLDSDAGELFPKAVAAFPTTRNCSCYMLTI